MWGDALWVAIPFVHLNFAKTLRARRAVGADVEMMLALHALLNSVSLQHFSGFFF